MTRVEAYVTTAVILLAALAAVAPRASAQTAGNSWVLEKGQGVATVKGSPASLALDDKQMSGSTGCNTFRATIADRPDKRVAISDVTLTRKLCAPQANNNERAIVQAFSKTEFVEQGPGTLTFLSGQREPLLVWKTVEKAAGSARAAMMPPLAGAKAHAAPKRVTKAQLARNEHRARATRASRKRAVHRRAKHSRIAHVSRRCRCLCGWWN